MLAGSGTLTARGRAHELEPEIGAYLPPGSEFELHNPRPETLMRVASARSPTPSPPATSAAAPRCAGWPTRRRRRPRPQREFRIVADPRSGLHSATHFVGYIPTGAAPDHFHTYDEVIYVLDGEGVMHAGDSERPLSPGSCIELRRADRPLP